MTETEHSEWTDEFEEDYDAFDGDGQTDVDESEEVSDSQPTGQAPSNPNDDRPAQERIGELLTKMNGQRKTLLRILDFCRDPVSVKDTNAAIGEWTKNNRSVFAPTTLCELLEKAGGLRHINADGTDYEVKTQTAIENSPDKAPDESDATPTEQTAESQRTDESAEGILDDETGGIEYLEVEQQAESYWVATEEGLAAVQADDPSARVARLLEDDAYYLPVYKEILESLADGPRTKPELDPIVRNSPLTQSPKRLTGYFVDRLEQAEAIEWTGPWSITALGRELLENDALYQ